MIVEIRNRKKIWTKFILDDEDINLFLSYRSWTVNNGYLVTQFRKLGKKYLIYFHRLIMPNVKLVDHINKNRYDNRRINLRSVTHSQNTLNTESIHHNKHGFRGVVYISKDRLFRAIIRINKKQKCIGHFNSAQEAALAYDSKAIEIFGHFAKTNFDWMPSFV